jgi:D-glycero-D-manno-heptose 1,7-bisphosphate phosphatase
MANIKQSVVFLDRDGTLNIEKGYLRSIEDLVLIPGAAQSVRRLNDAGFAAILVTNQSGAARKYYPESHIQDLHKRLQCLLAQEGAVLDAVYYCPHLPDGIEPSLTKVCHCRKPETGLIDRAYAQFPDLKREQSFMIGDKEADMGLALNATIKSIIVETGYGKDTLKILHSKNIKPDLIAVDINEAVDWILKN